MKKIIALLVALVLTLSLTAALADGIKIAIPNDATNEGRALPESPPPRKISLSS